LRAAFEGFDRQVGNVLRLSGRAQMALVDRDSLSAGRKAT